MTLLGQLESLSAEVERVAFAADYLRQHTEIDAVIRRCSLCDQCTALCPTGLSSRRVMKPWREIYAAAQVFYPDDLKSVQVDQEWHIFSVYRAVYGIYYPEFLGLVDLQPGQADTLFFPGCSLLSYAPSLTRKVGHCLSDLGFSWALASDCCGSPLISHGEIKRAQALRERLLEQCQRAGIRRVITICAGCGEELEQSFRGAIEVIPLPRLLLEEGFSGAVAALMGEAEPEAIAASDARAVSAPLTVFDSCHDRFGFHGLPLRRLLAQSHSTVEMRHHGRNTLCCGSGGAVPAVDAEISDRRVLRIFDEARQVGAETIVTSCPTCAYCMASKRVMGSSVALPQDVTSRHYLELLFDEDIDWQTVFARLQEMWTGEYGAWVCQQLL
jgi:Fe-S oxidoreductase